MRQGDREQQKAVLVQPGAQRVALPSLQGAPGVRARALEWRVAAELDGLQPEEMVAQRVPAVLLPQEVPQAFATVSWELRPADLQGRQALSAVRLGASSRAPRPERAL